MDIEVREVPIFPPGFIVGVGNLPCSVPLVGGAIKNPAVIDIRLECGKEEGRLLVAFLSGDSLRISPVVIGCVGSQADKNGPKIPGAFSHVGRIDGFF